jgi:hypothetical protein
MEAYLDFEKRILNVHKPKRINHQKANSKSGIKITAQWKITYPASAGIVLQNAVKDLQDYFAVSMELSLQLATADFPDKESIFVCTDESLQERSFRTEVTDRIIITGVNERYAAQGCYALEDRLNMNEAPFIDVCNCIQQMRFSFRVIDSGLHDGSYPDAYLNMIAHSGMTAVDVSLGNLQDDPERIKNINDLVQRATKYGLDVYCFPHFKNTVHPDDADAFSHYDQMYGRVLELCPGIKGFIIVGESCEFPSKDPRTTGKSWRESLDDEKSSPGWFPCYDYPQFISLLRDVIRSHSPDAEVVFWTYNWGYEEQSLREELIRNVPVDVTMMATFEMFENIDITPQIQEVTTDYTLWQIGPGKYFASESRIAKERNVRMYSMTNTGGNTWDIGGVPYLPAPQRWIQRWQAVTDTQDNLKIDGVRESHSYGFWPSFLPEMAKYAYMLPKTNMEDLLRRIVVRDYGIDHADDVLRAYNLFSEGMSHCVSTNEDQYGPARVGPSYPLVFKRWEMIPKCPVTGKNVNYEGFPVYTYNLDRTEKLQYETAEYLQMAHLFEAGCTILAGVIDTMEDNKKKEAEHVLQVAQYIRNNALTIYHVKRWHYLKGLLGIYIDAKPTWVGGRKNMVDAQKAKKPLIPVSDKGPVLQEMLSIAKAEIENAKNTIPLVETNSRLGFEKEYGYSCSRMHLDWKIQNLHRTITEELIPYMDNV